MGSLAVVVLGAFAATFALWLWVRAPHQRRPNERYGAERSYAAEAEVEDSDIAQMIEARNAIRRRRGKPEIGDEIVARLQAEIARGGPPPPGRPPGPPDPPTPPSAPPSR